MKQIKDFITSKKFIIVIVLIGLIISGFAGSYYYMKKSEKERQEELFLLEQKKLEDERLRKENIIINAQKNVANLYDEADIPKNDISDEEINQVIIDVNLVEDEEIKSTLLKQINEVNEYRSVLKNIDSLFIDNVLISTTNDNDIKMLQDSIDKLQDKWKNDCNEKLNNMRKQRSNILDADKKVKALFSDSKLTIVKTNVTRNKYNSVKNVVNKLPQKDLKKKYNEDLDKVLKEIEEREEKARKEAEEKARKEAEIKAAWVKLDVPYISQNKNQIYNGCEAASLLMGLQYKGYLKDASLKYIADEMPKSEDDPHIGFVRDIYGFEPRDVPHWIAPDALAKFGRSISGNNKIKDITGTNVEGLKKEIDKGNPVIIYATGGNFDDPINWVEEVPKNVHVMLLVGYNPKSNQMLINDPWTKTSTGQVYISLDRFTTIYNEIGKKAVVVG